jgi:photosystem II stability/assembly factor-like uncharacterized protein
MRIFKFLIVFITIAINSFPQANNSSNNNWQRLGPGGGGATFLPTFSYRSPEDFFIRCDMTGSYLTSDGGESYKQFNFDNGASSYAFDPNNNKIIYCGSVFLNRTTDGGKTWQQIFPKQSDITERRFYGDHAEYKIKANRSSLYVDKYSQIKNIKVDPIDSRKVYFSMGNYFFYTYDGCKVFQRTEVGHPINFIYTNKAILKDEVYIFTPSSLLIFNKISHSTKVISIPKEMLPAFSYSAGMTRDENKLVLYALHHINDAAILGQYQPSEVWKSEDNGHKWRKINAPVVTDHNSKHNFSKIYCAEFDAASAYLISDLYEEKENGISKYWYGALKTSDAGTNWQWVWKAGGGSGRYGIKDGKDAVNLRDSWASKAFGDEFIELEDIGVYPHDGNIAVLTDWYRAMKTVDGGKTWKEIYSNMLSDGSLASHGFDVTNVYDVHFDPFDSTHIALSCTDIGFWHSYNKGKSWFRDVAGVPGGWVNTCYSIVFDPVKKNKLWSAWSGMHDIPRGKMTRNANWKTNYKGGICISEDGGKTWQPSNSGLGDDALVTSLVLDGTSAVGHRTIYASVFNKGIFKSVDDGKSWLLTNNGIGSNTCAFQLALASDGTLYALITLTPNYSMTKNDTVLYSGAMYKSTDGAASWKKLALAPEPIFPNNIAVDPSNPDRIYISCWADIDLSDMSGGKNNNKTIRLPGGIFMSENAGETFTSIFDKQQYIYAVTIDPFRKGRLWSCSFNKAIYRSEDYGKTWKMIDGYDFHWGHKITVDPLSADNIYITTYGSGVWYGRAITK